MDRVKLLLVGFLGIFFIFLGACTTVGEKQADVVKPPVVAPGAKYVGMETCLGCHDKFSADVKTNVHLRSATKGCETCHGPGSIHAESENPKDIITFKEKGIENAFILSSQCLNCHARDRHVMYYKASAHFTSGVACTSCHRIHVKRSTKITSTIAQPYYDSVAKGYLKKQEPALCYECHSEIRAKTFYPSHHPIKEGKITCSDCHSVHGGPVGMLKTKENLNELCYRCHPDKRGPFAFEHPPVEEDCTICHDPHGSTAFSLLKKPEPILCLQCHHSHFQIMHHKDVQYTAAVRCTQCHVAIHGSNYPSHGVGTGGRALTR